MKIIIAMNKALTTPLTIGMIIANSDFFLLEAVVVGATGKSGDVDIIDVDDNVGADVNVGDDGVDVEETIMVVLVALDGGGGLFGIGLCGTPPPLPRIDRFDGGGGAADCELELHVHIVVSSIYTVVSSTALPIPPNTIILSSERTAECPKRAPGPSA